MTDYVDYKNKRVVITGCFSGMGEATARLLLSLGAEVHGLDFKDCALPLASFNNVDLRDPQSIDAAVAVIGGRVDALFNCAGLSQPFPPLDVIKVNFLGTRRLTDAIVPLMPAGSAIASISSTGAIRWTSRQATVNELVQTESFEAGVAWCEANAETVSEGYAFSKEAVVVWTLSTAASLIKRGIRMNCTLPGPTQTPMMAHFEAAASAAVLDAAAQPIGRRASPEEQASPLVFLNSDAAQYVNGVALPVDGGFMGGMATGLIDMSAFRAAAGH
jgi:NAD(P)-dependent dehydrogenase (short-subunit alcohol dehydrogenase family)